MKTIFENKIYCVGFGQFGQPELCKNCEKHILPQQIIDVNTILWDKVKYDPNTGECSMYESKIN